MGSIAPAGSTTSTTSPTGSTQPPAMETGRTPFPSDGLGAPIVSAPSTTSTSSQGNFGSQGSGNFGSQGSGNFGSQGSANSGSQGSGNFGSQGSGNSGSGNFGSQGSGNSGSFGSQSAAGAVPAPATMEARRSETYYETKGVIFGALIEAIDLAQLARLDADSAREEIRDIVNEIIAIKSIVMSIAEQEDLLDDICNDVLGFGPLEPLLARDDIADIMVNGAGTVYIEGKGKIQKTGIRFRDNQQLFNICQRMVSQVGRRVDEASPICDARLPDGSRVNVIVPPVSLDGTMLTISKFRKDKLKMQHLVDFGSISPEGAKVLEVIGASRCNVLISGGTGSGKTTPLNCLTGYIDLDERVITCEDAAELQLQQPHVVRLETRPPN